jgi:hypothetical protein
VEQLFRQLVPRRAERVKRAMSLILDWSRSHNKARLRVNHTDQDLLTAAVWRLVCVYCNGL